MTTPDGRAVRIVGQIDRVDVMRREGHDYVRVVDYKTGAKTFSLDDVYKTFALSKDYIRRQFIKEKGISPLQFLNNTRIAFAQKLLLSKNVNNYKIYEIAEMCGFSDQLYFSRVFKKITGISPKEYTCIPKADKYNSD